MATAFTPHHTMSGLSQRVKQAKAAKPSVAAKFFRDLWEDVRERPLQPAHLAKHDMFREHINAMSISYFGLIVFLIAASVPMLVFLVPLLTN